MGLIARAPAKVNLGLEILGRRPDGYHEIRTILQAIDLQDELSLDEAGALTLECPATLGPVDQNLVLRAARLLSETFSPARGARLRLRKEIPVAAGLGGGSADAAAALVGLNRLWNLELSLDDLTGLAATLGSDVPFFVRGGAQLATGRGEVLTPLRPARAWVVLAVPSPTAIDKTRRLYGALGPVDWTSGDTVRALVGRLQRDTRLGGEDLFSGFTRVTRDSFPEVERAFDALAEAGGVPALCGAGPAVMCLTASEAEARGLAERSSSDRISTYVQRTIGQGVTLDQTDDFSVA